MANTGLFPYIKTGQAVHELGDMTPASIINYRVPTARRSSSQLTYTHKVTTSKAASTIVTRQTTASIPLPFKLHISSPNQNPSSIPDQRKIIRRSYQPMDKNLSPGLVLNCKPIYKTQSVPNLRTEKTMPARSTTSDTLDPEPEKEAQQTIQQLISEYHRQSLHPYLNHTTSTTKKSFGRVELVDYSNSVVGSTIKR